MVKLTLILAMGVSFLFCGCGKKNPESAVGKELLEVMQIDLSSLQQKIRQTDGKMKVVNFWATWCEPCKEEMPHLVELRKNFGEKIELLLVAIDDASTIDTVMKPILKNAGVEFLCYIKQEGRDEEFINGINPQWSGALPTTFIYNSEGKEVEMLTGEQTYEKFEEAVKKYLEQ